MEEQLQNQQPEISKEERRIIQEIAENETKTLLERHPALTVTAGALVGSMISGAIILALNKYRQHVNEVETNQTFDEN